MKKKEEIVEKTIDGIRDISAKIDDLQVQADLAKEEARVKYMAKVDDLKRKKASLENKVFQLSQAEKEASETLKKGVIDAYEDLSGAVKSAVKTIKGG